MKKMTQFILQAIYSFGIASVVGCITYWLLLGVITMPLVSLFAFVVSTACGFLVLCIAAYHFAKSFKSAILITVSVVVVVISSVWVYSAYEEYKFTHNGKIVITFNSDIPFERATQIVNSYQLSIESGGGKNRYFISVPVGSEDKWIEEFKNLPEVEEAQYYIQLRFGLL